MAKSTKPKPAKKSATKSGKNGFKQFIVRSLRFLWKCLWIGTLSFFILSLLTTILYRWVPVPVTPLMVIRYFENKNEGKTAQIDKDWVSREEISEYLQLAVVCSEDQNYLEHYGFDFGAIEKAMKENKTRKIPRGASTISQQTAKNVFLWQGRNYLRKGLEVYFTFLIETFWTKERIMEVYLNVIEMGDGIYGAQAASKNYFNKNASSLSPSEAALIAAILPNPRKFSAKNPSAYTQKRRDWVLKQMRFWGMKLDYDKYDQVIEEEESKEQKSVKKRKKRQLTF